MGTGIRQKDVGIEKNGHWMLENDVLDLKIGASWAVLVEGLDPVVAKTGPKGGPERRARTQLWRRPATRAGRNGGPGPS